MVKRCFVVRNDQQFLVFVALVLACVSLFTIIGNNALRNRVTDHRKLYVVKTDLSGFKNCDQVGRINSDASTTAVHYTNPKFGLSFDVPYNPRWGSDLFRVNPYDEGQQGAIKFGPIECGTAEGLFENGISSIVYMERTYSINSLGGKSNIEYWKTEGAGPYQPTIEQKQFGNLTVYLKTLSGDYCDEGVIVKGAKGAYSLHTYDCDGAESTFNKFLPVLQTMKEL